MTREEFESVRVGAKLITSTPELLLELGYDCTKWDDGARSVLGLQTATVVHAWGRGDGKRVNIDLDNCCYIYNRNDFIGFAVLLDDKDFIAFDEDSIEDTDKSVLFFVE